MLRKLSTAETLKMFNRLEVCCASEFGKKDHKQAFITERNYQVVKGSLLSFRRLIQSPISNQFGNKIARQTNASECTLSALTNIIHFHPVLKNHQNTAYLFGLSFTGLSLGDEGEQQISSISFLVTFSFGSICASQQVILSSIPVTSKRDRSVCLRKTK